MLVYYFIPFVVNNRYLLFQVSSGHNSVTVQNQTHVHMNFFCLESLILSFPKVVQIPPESPCMLFCTQTGWERNVCCKQGTQLIGRHYGSIRLIIHMFGGRCWTTSAPVIQEILRLL